MVDKLRSQKGASFIIAMVYFLICMMVGSVMITAASVDRGRAAASVIEQRNYYAVQSAALMFRDALQGKTYEDEFEYFTDTVSGTLAEYSNQGYTKNEGADSYSNVSGDPKELINQKLPTEIQFKDIDSSDPFSRMYEALAKHYHYKFLEATGKLADSGVTDGAAPKMTGEIRLEGCVPVKYSLEVMDDYTIVCDFSNIPAAAAASADTGDTGDDAPAGSGSHSLKDKVYSINLTLKPTGGNIMRSSDFDGGSDTPERRKIPYYIKKNVSMEKDGVWGTYETYSLRTLVVDKAAIKITYSTATLSKGKTSNEGEGGSKTPSDGDTDDSQTPSGGE